MFRAVLALIVKMTMTAAEDSYALVVSVAVQTLATIHLVPVGPHLARRGVHAQPTMTVLEGSYVCQEVADVLIPAMTRHVPVGPRTAGTEVGAHLITTVLVDSYACQEVADAVILAMTHRVLGMTLKAVRARMFAMQLALTTTRTSATVAAAMGVAAVPVMAVVTVPAAVSHVVNSKTATTGVR